jgi:hypothetical protein
VRLDMSEPQIMDEPPTGGCIVVELHASDKSAVMGVWAGRSSLAFFDSKTLSASAAQPVAQRAVWPGVIIGGGREIVVAGQSWQVTDAIIVQPPQGLSADEAKRTVASERGDLRLSNLMILLAGGTGRPLDEEGRVIAAVAVRAPVSEVPEDEQTFLEQITEREPVVGTLVNMVESEGGIHLATENSDGTFSQSTLYSELHPGHPASTAQHAAVRADDGHLYGIVANTADVTVYDLTESERQGHLEITGVFPVINGNAIPSPKQPVFPGGPHATVVHVRDDGTYPDRTTAEQAGFPVTGDSPLQQAARTQGLTVNRAGQAPKGAQPSAGDHAARIILYAAGRAPNGFACVGDASKLHRMMTDATTAHEVSVAVAARHRRLLAIVHKGASPTAEREIRTLTKAMRATGIGIGTKVPKPVQSQDMATAVEQN